MLRTALTLLVVSYAAAWQVITSSMEQSVRVSIITSLTVGKNEVLIGPDHINNLLNSYQKIALLY